MRGHRARAGTPLIIVGLVLGLTGLTLFLAPDDRVTAEIGSVLDLPASDLPDSGRRDATTPPPPLTPLPTPQTSVVTTPGFTPERLLVETLDVDALLVTTLVDTDGALVPPEDPAQLGWWRGVRPGEGEGSVVIAGHIDSRRFGQGPLARIVELEPGDRAV
ncbi:MAG: class F sortase, partial [Actinomycetota bacterium]|nr:class F sortase [Actinomycetota bacterium]